VPGSIEGLGKWDIRVSGTRIGRRNGKASIDKNMIVGVIANQAVASNLCKILF
jgi:hypothetical protein